MINDDTLWEAIARREFQIRQRLVEAHCEQHPELGQQTRDYLEQDWQDLHQFAAFCAATGERPPWSDVEVLDVANDVRAYGFRSRVVSAVHLAAGEQSLTEEWELFLTLKRTVDAVAVRMKAKPKPAPLVTLWDTLFVLWCQAN